MNDIGFIDKRKKKNCSAERNNLHRLKRTLHQVLVTVNEEIILSLHKNLILGLTFRLGTSTEFLGKFQTLSIVEATAEAPANSMTLLMMAAKI